ncbi:MAG: cation:proton antiporter [Ignavibacteriales bacterium]|nr:cation:proton antiporter [Ignavibacteriales bacterium]
MNAYFIIIIASSIVIISYFFNLISSSKNIPSILLLIALGIIAQIIVNTLGIQPIDIMKILEILGIIGLILIVLEAALDLEIKLNELSIIWKSFLIALISLTINVLAIGILFYVFYQMKFIIALIYAVPLSIISSAIVIPSIFNLDSQKREMMIYESTFSDILGIMAFYFLLSSTDYQSFGEIGISITSNIFITILISILISYVLIVVFQNLNIRTKLFLLVSVLLLFYSIGKLLHLSSLIIILIFGLIINNRNLFFRGFLKRFLNEEKSKKVFEDFKLITIESSFIVRTFFFVIFGFSINFSSLLNFKVIFISILIFFFVFFFRYVILKISLKRDIKPLIYIAPRGLITILLFFSIPQELVSKNFQDGILFFIIISTCSIMAWNLIKNNKSQNLDTSKNG